MMQRRKHDVVPFPQDWWRNIDFICPLTLQDAFQPDKEMIYLEAHGSTSKDKSRIAREPKKIGGLQVIETHRTSTGANIKIGNPQPGHDPANEVKTTARDILDDLPEFGVDDAVIKERIVTHDLPPRLKKHEVLSQFNDFYELQNASARRTRSLRRSTNLPIWDIYRNLLRPELIKAGIIYNSARLQSMLMTNWLVPCEKEHGYLDLASDHQQLLLALNADIQNRRRWWLDTAAPYTRDFRVDGIHGSLRVFRLVKNQELTALALSEPV